MTLAFELDGQTFTALNGNPLFKFTEAVSFVVQCDYRARQAMLKMKKLDIAELERAAKA